MAIRAHVIGIKSWKRWQITPFLKPLYERVSYWPSADVALKQQQRAGGDLVVWAAREPADFVERATKQNAKIVRIEDGFIRSVGLGSNHVGGYSLVVDSDGIYFDPRRPSTLENLLQHGTFTPDLLTRAESLRSVLVNGGLTKYNVGSAINVEIPAQGKTRVLVPGQVEDDASVRFGGGEIQSNLQLLMAVRKECPDAWIIYKPHPDTEAGTRIGSLDESTALQYADQVIHNTSASALFGQIDAVHTLTSLLGFEALMRGVPVTVWGQPFYAGWGITTDRMSHPRRTRRLSLMELVAGTLLLYPRYVHPETRLPCEAEEMVQTLLNGPRVAHADSSLLRRYARLCHGWLKGLTL